MCQKLLTLILCLTFIISINAQQTNKKYFEGEVHFEITSKAFDNRISQKLLDLETGNKMVGMVKKNKYLMYQNSAGKLGRTKMVFLLEEGVGYIEYENSDTITQFSIERNPDKLVSKNLNEKDIKVILGDTCKSITFNFIPQLNFGVIEYVEAKYYFNPKHKLDIRMYKNHGMNFWNKFVEMSRGGISVRNEIIYYPLYSTTYEAVEIIEKEISEQKFEIDKTKFIIKED